MLHQEKGREREKEKLTWGNSKVGLKQRKIGEPPVA